MDENRQDVRWAPRVPKWKVRRLYDQACRGIWDEELTDDVGMTLYLRCADILKIHSKADFHHFLECLDEVGAEALADVGREFVEVTLIA